MNIETAMLCPCCDTGYLREQRIDYPVDLADGVKVIVRDVPAEVCDHCGEIAFSADAAMTIDHAIAEQTEQLTPRELVRIREDIGVDQAGMSEMLGLGEKTYHRWEKGNQFPSRSMGFYLRVLKEFPEAVEWLRDRGWQRQNRINSAQHTFNFSSAFPCLPPQKGNDIVSFKKSRNPAMALFGRGK